MVLVAWFLPDREAKDTTPIAWEDGGRRRSGEGMSSGLLPGGDDKGRVFGAGDRYSMLQARFIATQHERAAGVSGQSEQ